MADEYSVEIAWKVIAGILAAIAVIMVGVWIFTGTTSETRCDNAGSMAGPGIGDGWANGLKAVCDIADSKRRQEEFMESLRNSPPRITLPPLPQG